MGHKKATGPIENKQHRDRGKALLTSGCFICNELSSEIKEQIGGMSENTWTNNMLSTRDALLTHRHNQVESEQTEKEVPRK